MRPGGSSGLWAGSGGKATGCDALLELDLLVGRRPGWAECPGELGLRQRGVVSGHRLVGVLDGAQPGCDTGLAGGDGLPVAPTVGAFGQVSTVLLDLPDMGLALVGVRGEGEHGDAGGGGVQDEGDRAGFGVVAGQGGDPGPAVSGQAGSGALPPRRARA
jgi:hypothetical protein